MQYRLITTRLRIQRGPGKPDLVCERPHRRTETGRVFLDGDKPTLISFDADCQVDIPFLEKIGAIEPYKPPAKVARGKKRRGDDNANR